MSWLIDAIRRWLGIESEIMALRARVEGLEVLVHNNGETLMAGLREFGTTKREQAEEIAELRAILDGMRAQKASEPPNEPPKVRTARTFSEFRNAAASQRRTV